LAITKVTTLEPAVTATPVAFVSVRVRFEFSWPAVQPAPVSTPLVVTDGEAPRFGTVVPTVPEQVVSSIIGELEQKSKTMPRSVVWVEPVGIVKFTLYEVVAALPVIAEELSWMDLLVGASAEVCFGFTDKNTLKLRIKENRLYSDNFPNLNTNKWRSPLIPLSQNIFLIFARTYDAILA